MEPDWRAAVAVREDPELARLLAARLPDPSAPRPVSVTELLGLRPAFWRALAPVAIEPERQRRLDLGRMLHRRLGVALSAEGALEVRVRRDGLVGRIDLLSDAPVEVKTSASSIAPDQLRGSRPDHVEQLAMYCALADRPTGRLVTVVVTDGIPTSVQVAELAIRDPGAVRSEMLRRAELVRQAWAARRADSLPRCRWYGRGCEFQETSTCDCVGAEAPPDSRMLSEVVEIRERPDLASRIDSRLQQLAPPGEPPTIGRFRDLIFPRLAYFERVRPPVSVEPTARDPRGPPDLYTRLVGAVESGPLGEVARVPSATDEPEEEVGGFRGTPYLVRTSRSVVRASPRSLVDRQPQYALDLGFRCVATGAPTARLILGRERASGDADRVQVFEFRFDPASRIARLWRQRSRQLADALASGQPAALPPCPAWAFATCPYRSECGCADAGVRSQR